MALIRSWQPSSVRRKVRNLYELFAVPAKRLSKGVEIEPLQVRFFEVVDGMIQVEAVNIATNANHCVGMIRY
jgi:hypothetical protein